jgi:DnaJ-class molecular chaperone
MDKREYNEKRRAICEAIRECALCKGSGQSKSGRTCATCKGSGTDLASEAEANKKLQELDAPKVQP